MQGVVAEGRTPSAEKVKRDQVREADILARTSRKESAKDITFKHLCLSYNGGIIDPYTS